MIRNILFDSEGQSGMVSGKGHGLKGLAGGSLLNVVYTLFRKRSSEILRWQHFDIHAKPDQQQQVTARRLCVLHILHVWLTKSNMAHLGL